jgi:hypothetical protein
MPVVDIGSGSGGIEEDIPTGQPSMRISASSFASLLVEMEAMVRDGVEGGEAALS